MTVRIHRLRDGGVAEPRLNGLRVQSRGDERRCVEVAKIVEPGAFGQPDVGDGLAPAVAE
jgi:hypothetical protein